MWVLIAVNDLIVVYHFGKWLTNKYSFVGRTKLVRGYRFYLLQCVFEAIANALIEANLKNAALVKISELEKEGKDIDDELLNAAGKPIFI